MNGRLYLAGAIWIGLGILSIGAPFFWWMGVVILGLVVLCWPGIHRWFAQMSRVDTPR